MTSEYGVGYTQEQAINGEFWSVKSTPLNTIYGDLKHYNKYLEPYHEEIFILVGLEDIIKIVDRKEVFQLIPIWLIFYNFVLWAIVEQNLNKEDLTRKNTRSIIIVIK